MAMHGEISGIRVTDGLSDEDVDATLLHVARTRDGLSISMSEQMTVEGLREIARQLNRIAVTRMHGMRRGDRHQ